jgi:hypothetical protein
METKDTAVALLKEWKSRKEDIEAIKFFGNLDGNDLRNVEFLENEMESLSRRLDEIAKAAGIILKDGYFMYSDINAHYDFGRFDVRFRISGGNLPAREQQAIQEWLLIKNEEKTA